MFQLTSINFFNYFWLKLRITVSVDTVVLFYAIVEILLFNYDSIAANKICLFYFMFILKCIVSAWLNSSLIKITYKITYNLIVLSKETL